jgi:hypothetical protein
VADGFTLRAGLEVQPHHVDVTTSRQGPVGPELVFEPPLFIMPPLEPPLEPLLEPLRCIVPPLLPLGATLLFGVVPDAPELEQPTTVEINNKLRQTAKTALGVRRRMTPLLLSSCRYPTTGLWPKLAGQRFRPIAYWVPSTLR